MSSKSFPGVLEDRDVLDGAGDGVKVLNISQGSFTKSFIKIQHLEVCQESTYPKSLPGVLEERDVLDGAVDSVKELNIS